MKYNQAKFEASIFQDFRKSFREVVEEEKADILALNIIQRFISTRNYKELIHKIKGMQDFTQNSFSMENIKLDWWEGFLKDNMHETKDKKIALTDFEGKIIEFNSMEQVYLEFIKVKNETIWEPYYNVFTKIFVEWVTEIIIKGCNELSIESQIDFLNKSILKIEKEQVFEEYTKYKLNEHLKYYRSMLEFAVKDISVQNASYSNEKLFSTLTGNDRINNLKASLLNKQFENFFDLIKVIYSSLPYQIFEKNEAYFHSIFHVILYLISSTTRSEESTNIGRIDSVIELGNTIYIFEFKLDDPNEAIKQIKDKQYYQKFLQPDREIYLIGVAFELNEKNIKGWKIEKI